jgi:hypothetical protein
VNNAGVMAVSSSSASSNPLGDLSHLFRKFKDIAALVDEIKGAFIAEQFHGFRKRICGPKDYSCRVINSRKFIEQLFDPSIGQYYRIVSLLTDLFLSVFLLFRRLSIMSMVYLVSDLIKVPCTTS